MKSIILAASLAAMSGCAQFRAVETAVATHGAEAADTALRANLWGACEAATIGAVRRWIGADEQTAIAYDRLCSERPTILPVRTTETNVQR